MADPIVGVLADVLSHFSELGIPPPDGPLRPEDVPALARRAAGALRSAGLAGAAAEIEALLDRLAAETLRTSSRAGGLCAEAFAALLRQTSDVLSAAAPALPAERVAQTHFALRRGTENLRALLARLDPARAPAAGAGPREVLKAAAALCGELPPEVAQAARRHLDHLAAQAEVPLPVLLSGGAPLPSVAAVCDTLLNLAAELRPAAPAAEASAAWPADASGLVSPAWSQLFHFHVPKCAGTSLNAWLDTLAGEARRWRSEALTVFLDVALGARSEAQDALVGRALPLRQLSLARIAFHASDVVHDHRPLHGVAPAGTCIFTVLRRPAPRLLSQVADWRRLTGQDRARETREIASALEDAARLTLRDFLRAHGRGALRSALDNGMTRLFASGRLGPAALGAEDPAPLLGPALESLESDFALVGLTEELAATRHALAALLGLPPPGALARLNETDSSRALAEEVTDAAPEIEALTALDERLFEHARRLFDARHAHVAAAWTDAAFEESSAERATARLRGLFRDGAIAHSVRAPLIGRGFHPRDGLDVGDCAVWSGPEPTLVLYLPVPPGLDLELLVWVRGYADPAQRARLVLRADGQRLPHAFEPCPGWAERLVAPFRPRRPFVRLEIDLGETRAAPPEDPRPRGLCFDAYGWRPA